MKVAIVGIGIGRFGLPTDLTGMQHGAQAARLALKDAGLEWKDIQFACGGSYSSGNAEAISNVLGLTGLPFTNILNGCATGGSSLLAACKQIRAGDANVGLVVGFDKHARGAFNASPSEYGLDDWYGEAGMMVTTQFFAAKIQKYMHNFGITVDALARVAEKAYRNGALNEHAWRRTPIGLEEIKTSQMVNDPLTKFMFCSPSAGGVALVVCREDVARRYSDRPIYIRAAAMRSRLFGAFEVYGTFVSNDEVPNASTQASAAAYEIAGVGPEDIDVVQLQDTEAGAEIMHMAENGFCADGEQEQMLLEGQTRIEGRLPVNTDGGCLASGEPIGASGLRQIHEIVLQLRGQAGKRQVGGDPRLGYTHVYGAPGISAVTILER